MDRLIADLREIARLADCPPAHGVDGKTLAPMVQIGALAKAALERCEKRNSTERAHLLSALYDALPIVEDAEKDPAYRPGYVHGVTTVIRSAINKAEGQ